MFLPQVDAPRGSIISLFFPLCALVSLWLYPWEKSQKPDAV